MRVVVPLLVSALLLWNVEIVVAADCCPYPVTTLSARSSVDIFAFKCAEPINITCSLGNSRLFNSVAIFGNNSVTTPKAEGIIQQDFKSVTLEVKCDPASHLWSVAFLTVQYESFACAKQSTVGVWVAQ